MTTCPKCKYHHVDEMAQIGVCRRYPPQAQQLGANWNATFPPVNKNWTCGEFAASDAATMFTDPQLKPIWTPVELDASAKAPEASAEEDESDYGVPEHIRKIALRLAVADGEDASDWLRYVGDAYEFWDKIKPVDNAKPPIDAA